jgi:hypothetical protein
LDLTPQISSDRMFVFEDRYEQLWELDTRSHADLVAIGRELEDMYEQRARERSRET